LMLMARERRAKDSQEAEAERKRKQPEERLGREMLVGLIGGRGAGKKTIQAELVRRHGFRELRIEEAEGWTAPSTRTSTTGMAEEPEGPLSFRSAQDLLRFATAHWTHDFVTLHLHSPSRILPFLKRPFFVLVYLHAPLSHRWARIRLLAPSSLSFEEFVREDDRAEYGERRETAAAEEEKGEDVTTEREDERRDGERRR